MIGIIDTHILVRYFEASAKISAAQNKFLEDEKNTLVIPSIVLCELKYLVNKGRIGIAFVEIVERLTADTCVEICALDQEIARLLPTELDIHDGIIVATYLQYAQKSDTDVYLLTHDRRIKETNIAVVLN